ncbi:MAG: hypothetical protein OEV63_00175 [Gammaproteobacteria bacterium]|nr:hypothetical protein [Gammaproteobacteria bacterium]
MMRIFTQTVLLWLAGVAGSALAQSDDTTERLIACARIEESAARAACYEALGQEVLDAGRDKTVSPAKQPGNTSPKAETAKEMSVAAASTAAATGETSAPTNVPFKGDERPTEEFRVAVSSCEQNRNSEFYFFLENGEIWKQTGGKRVKTSECVFEATLRKDVFGYKMTIDGEKSGIRVKRVQ